jgi:NAD(P) transhydrogenase subunit beta
MIAMPQMIALLNGLGGLASLLVGMFAYLGIGADIDPFSQATALLAIIIGGITFTGSLVAAGKLARLINQKPIRFKFQQQTLIALIILMLAVLVYGVIQSFIPAIYLLVILSFVFGVIFTMQIGGADMPIAISLLNSLSGVAGAISGLAIGDVLLVVIGGIVGASGLLLTQIMCKAMNRRLFEILLGKTTVVSTKVKKEVTEKPVQDKKISEEKTDYKAIINSANKVIIIPGYGMAVAQAQHVLRQIGDKFKDQGKDVKYAIHPVAGRMPGHMNVLLAEADVDYDELYEMDEINSEFKDTDLVIVVGANDVLNPAAREAEGTPIYGMPILNADEAKNIFIFNYDLKPGYSGVENPLYTKENGIYLFLGNALDTLEEFAKSLNEEVKAEQVKEEVKADYKDILKTANKVIIIPGYGMAVAQAQHILRQIGDKFKDQGKAVKYAIHPVAGRMPGHMNVLLAETDVDYDELYEMDDVNDEFKDTDLVIVVGANDVLNPAAREAEGTPIYGMPILNADEAKNIFIFNYDLKPGYSGVENPLYTKKTGVYLFLGNALDTLKEFEKEL